MSLRTRVNKNYLEGVGKNCSAISQNKIKLVLNRIYNEDESYIQYNEERRKIRLITKNERIRN